MGLAIFLAVQKHSTEAVIHKIEEIAYQLRLACFLTGSQSLSDLGKVHLVITGRTAEIMRINGIDPIPYFTRD